MSLSSIILDNLPFLILDMLGLVVIAVSTVRLVRLYRRRKGKQFFTFKRFRYLLIVTLMIGILLIFLYALPEHMLRFEFTTRRINFISVLFSLSISLIWIHYIRKLDIYEEEKWYFITGCFLLGCGTTFLVFPMTDFIHSMGFFLNNRPVNDFLYAVIGIGLVEEIVKMIPVWLLLLFTRAIDEPYDYILYGSISALGFAFVENVLYIDNSELFGINARALFASVAHMMFTSTACYGLMLAKFRYKKYGFILGLGFLLLAAGAHGFYDFWLINNWASQYTFVTIVFFLITIHFWFTMKNNAINISNYYRPGIRVDNERLKYFLVTSLLAILMLSVIAVRGLHGPEWARQFFASQILAFGYLIFYIVYSFSQYRVIKGYLAPMEIPFNVLIPKGKKQ